MSQYKDHRIITENKERSNSRKKVSSIERSAKKASARSDAKKSA